MTEELAVKLNRIRSWLDEKQTEGILFSSLASFSWLTGGRGHIGLASEQASGKILVTPSGAHLLFNNIEAERIVSEELLFPAFDVNVFPWYEPEQEKEICRRILQGNSWMEEQQVAGEVAKLRWELTSFEMERYRETGRIVANVLEKTCRQIRQGDSEKQIAARLAANCLRAGVDPVLQLVAVDERTGQYRHPLPTERTLKNYAMVVVGGRKNGLIVSATRLVHFGPLPEELAKKQHDVALIDAELIAGTRPGNKINDMFSRLKQRYGELGYEKEWSFHHQGGLTGYLSREFRATDRLQETVKANQAYAWNPTIRGTKSEDTILVGETQNEILTETGDWPQIECKVQNRIVLRPAILILQM